MRKSETRVPEKQYPAFGSKVSDEHVSALCSQLSKEFEDVVRDEKRRSMSDLSQISTKEIYNKSRRKTTFIPKSQSGRSSSHEKIQNDRVQENDSDSIASDDSDRVIIDGKVSKPQSSFCNFIEDSFNGRIDVSGALLFNGVEKNIRNSSISNKEISDMDLTDNISTVIETPPSAAKSSNLVNQSLKNSASIESTNESTESGLAYVDNSTSANKKLTNNISTHTVMSSLRLSTESDQTKSHLDSKQNTRTSKSTIGTTMSPLQLEVSVEDKENVISSPLKKSEIKSTNGNKNSRPKTVDDLLNPTKNRVTPSKRKTLTTNSVDSLNDSSNSSDDLESIKKRRTISYVTNNRKSCKRNIASDPEFQDCLEKLDKAAPVLIKSLDVSKKSSSDQSSKGSFKTPIKTVPTTTQSTSTITRPIRRCTISSIEKEPKTPRQQRLRVVRNSSKKSETIPKNTKQPTASLKRLETEESRNSEELSEDEKSGFVQDSSKEVSKLRRKLYNPDEVSFNYLFQDDIQQREERRQQKIAEQQIPFVQISTDQRKIVDKFLNPNNVKMSKSAKKKTDESKNGKNTNQQSDESDSDSFCLKTPPNTRRSRRLSVSQATARNGTNSSSSIVLPKPLPNRRSTLDFMSLTQTQQKRRLRLDPNRKTSITCTRLHRQECDKFESTVRDLGKFYVEDNVTVHTSHLVAGEPKRTINMLKAIARGCWIVSYKWVSTKSSFTFCNEQKV